MGIISFPSAESSSSQQVITLPSSAGENLNAGDIVKLINQNGIKAFKYLSLVNGTDLVPWASEVNVSSNNTAEFIASARLTDTSFVVAFKNGSSYLACLVFNVSGTSISVSASNYNLLSNTAISYITIVPLTSSSFVISYQLTSTAYLGAVACSVSGGTITTGTPKANLSNSQGAYYISMAALSSTSVVISYFNITMSALYSIICNVSGNVLTEGAVKSFFSVYSDYVSVTALTSTSFAVVYKNSNQYLNAVIGTITAPGETTITVGTPKTDIYNSVVYFQTSMTLSPTSFVITYKDNTSSFLGAVICNVNDTTITSGTPNNNLSDSLAVGGFAYSISLAPITSTKFIINYRSGVNGYLLGVCCETTDINTIIKGTIKTLYNHTFQRGVSAIYLSPVNYVAAVDGPSYYLSLIGYTNKETVILSNAVANTSITSGNTGNFTLLKNSMEVTNSGYNLQTGYRYFLNTSTSALQTTPTNYYLGIATDTTKMYVDGSVVFKSIQPNKPKVEYTYIGSPSPYNWYPILDVVGTGTCSRISIVNSSSLMNYDIDIKITLDGDTFILNRPTSTSYAAALSKSNNTSTSGATQAMVDYLETIYFRNSLKIEVRTRVSGSYSMDSAINYALE